MVTDPLTHLLEYETTKQVCHKDHLRFQRVTVGEELFQQHVVKTELLEEVKKHFRKSNKILEVLANLYIVCASVGAARDATVVDISAIFAWFEEDIVRILNLESRPQSYCAP